MYKTPIREKKYPKGKAPELTAAQSPSRSSSSSTFLVKPDPSVFKKIEKTRTQSDAQIAEMVQQLVTSSPQKAAAEAELKAGTSIRFRDILPDNAWKLASTYPTEEFCDEVRNSNFSIGAREWKTLKKDFFQACLNLYYLSTERDVENVEIFLPHIALTVIYEAHSGQPIKCKHGHYIKAAGFYNAVTTLIDKIDAFSFKNESSLNDCDFELLNKVCDYLKAHCLLLQKSFDYVKEKQPEWHKRLIAEINEQEPMTPQGSPERAQVRSAHGKTPLKTPAKFQDVRERDSSRLKQYRLSFKSPGASTPKKRIADIEEPKSLDELLAQEVTPLSFHDTPIPLQSGDSMGGIARALFQDDSGDDGEMDSLSSSSSSSSEHPASSFIADLNRLARSASDDDVELLSSSDDEDVPGFLYKKHSRLKQKHSLLQLCDAEVDNVSSDDESLQFKRV